MKITSPAYYPSFACLAGGCLHSCCIGWDIEIDEKTLAAYRAYPDGKSILRHIDVGKDGAFIRKKRDGRCPFLTEDGLCHLYREHGKESLSEICAKHPRYYSYLTGRTEIGLGLSCEAAVPLILKAPTAPDSDVVLSDDGAREEVPDEERELLATRDRLLARLCDANVSVREALGRTPWFDAYLPSLRKAMALLANEDVLDPAWETVLCEALRRLPDTNADAPLSDSTESRALLCYFLRRYLPQILGEEDVNGAGRVLVSFACLSVRVILFLAESGILPIAEAARSYSSEVEYDPDIVADLCDALQMRDI